MIDQAHGAFRSASNTQADGYSTNIADLTGPAVYYTLPTGGAAIVDKVNNVPSSLERWHLISMAITAHLVFTVQGQVSPFGRFGRIVAALQADPMGSDVNTTGDSSRPYNRGQDGIPELPNDPSLMFDLWDPSNDPMPPTVRSNFDPPLVTSPYPTAPMLISGSLNLPWPRDILPGGQVGVGIWMLPSLLGVTNNPLASSFGLLIVNANYTVTYDDLRPPL